MAVSYKKLWKLLIDKDMKKKDLCTYFGTHIPSVYFAVDFNDIFNRIEIQKTDISNDPYIAKATCSI